MNTAESHSSKVFFSGYRPIEVTADEYWNIIDDEGVKDSERKKNNSYHRSMSRRIGGLLPSRRKKNTTDIKREPDDDKNSISESSNQGQQSVGNKTIDSGTTIKASNLYPDQSQIISSVSQAIECVSTRQQSADDDDNNNNNNDNDNNNRQTRPPKSWKSLKRLVNKGRGKKELSSSMTSQELPGINPQNSFQRRHAKSHDGAILLGLIPSSPSRDVSYPLRKRIFSEGLYVPNLKQQQQQQQQQQQRDGTKSFSGGSVSPYDLQYVTDQVIRGRYDGIDVLSLGPASRASLAVKSFETKISVDSANKSSSQSIHENAFGNNGDCENELFDPLYRSFTTLEHYASPAKLVDEMIWTSGGIDQPEVILEGFHPGDKDRWSVCIPPPSLCGGRVISNYLKTPNDENYSVSELSNNVGVESSTNDDSNAVSSPCKKTTDVNRTTDVDENSNPPIAELWNSLWGLFATPPPVPYHMSMGMITNATKASDGSKDEYHLSKGDDEIRKFVETCNVPVDLDDDAFIIHCPQHLQSVHEHLMIPLRSRYFDFAISIFEKIKRGVEGNKKFDHLNASTNHNIGMIHLCQGSYREALESFGKAAKIRNQCLPPDHPDIAVSLQRKGMTYFALGSMHEALRCFEAALAICAPTDITRAKILNNIGVTRYQLEDHSQALKSFTSALEIQRPWLEGSVRRESIVYSASITLSNMGKVYLRKGDHDLAYLVFEEAYLLQISTFRKDHDIVLFSLDNMARAHAKTKNYGEALRIFSSLYRSQEARFGPDSESCIETVGMMGRIHSKLLDYEKAEKCMKKVRAWQIERGVNASHRSVRFVNEQIRRIKQRLQERELVWV